MAELVRFQHYEVLRRDDGSLFELGRGAMGITYKAFDTNLRTNVALKVINATYLNSEVARQRFLREARAAAAIRHPNVATVFHLGNEDDSYFYAMEFIDGETVEAFMQREGAVPTLMALEIAAQVARALAAAEKQGLVHRDIKPSNLMLIREDDQRLREAGDDEFTVKVIDFGLAKAAEKDSADAATLTQGGFLGTPHFASPEQLEETELDSRSDIYSLGITLYYMLAGRTPFSGSLAQVMSQHLHREPPMELLADQPRQVIALLERMMAKDREERPQTPTELRREIETCVDAVSNAHTGTVGGAPAEAADADTITDAPREPSALEPAPGVKLAGRLELLDAYQPGEFGKTFRARDLETKKIVAVLILDPNLLPTSEAYTRLENEVTAVQAIKHPAVIRVYSLERAHHLSFVTREWIEGLSLLDAMRKRGTLPVGDALEILTSLAGGLEAVQKTGVPCPALSAHWITLVKDVETGATIPKFNALNFAAVAPLSPDATMVPMPAAQYASPSGGEYVFTLASLAYRLLGGMSGAGGSGDSFIPIPGLSEDANLVLRRAMRLSTDFPSPVAFMAALEDAVGDAPAAPSKPPRLPSMMGTAVRPRSSLPLVVAVVLVLLLAALIGAILLVLPGMQNALEAGRREPSPSPTPVETSAPAPTPSPTPEPTPDARKVALDEAVKRVQEMAMSENYAAALNLLDELLQEYPEAADRLKDETEKITAKLGSETNDLLNANQLAALGDLLDEASQRGSKSAQMLLGKSYLATDPDKAFKYFYLAASVGNNSEAMYQVGDLFASGRGTDQNDKEAFAWYERSVKLLEPQAMFKLGQAYFFGKGVAKDPSRAYQILKLAADGYDNPQAQNLLGDIYRKGVIVPSNYDEAFRLWTRATAHGWLDAQANLGVMYIVGEVIDGKPVAKTPQPDRADVGKAFQLFKDGALLGNAACAYNYAKCLLAGLPGVVDVAESEGRKYMVKAAEKGDRQAQEYCKNEGWEFTPSAR